MTQFAREWHRPLMFSPISQRVLIVAGSILLAKCQLKTAGTLDGDSSTVVEAGGTSGTTAIVIGGAPEGESTSTDGGIAGVSSATTGATESATGGTGSIATSTSTDVTSTGGATDGGTLSMTGGTLSMTGGTSSSSSSTETGGAGSATTIATSGGSSTGGCSEVLTGADPCSSISAFSGDQVLDGVDGEFCGISSFELSFSNADTVVEYNLAADPGTYPEVATVRVAWSTSYLHAFIRVVDSEVVSASDLATIWNADGIDLLITTDAAVTGSTVDDTSAMHLIVSPGAGAEPGLAAQVKTTGTTGEQTALLADTFVTVTDSTGYTVELKVPWPDGATLEAGRSVYFDFTLNSAGSTVLGSNGRDAQAIFYLGSVPSPSPCGDTVYPYCDDRSWCSTLLE